MIYKASVQHAVKNIAQIVLYSILKQLITILYRDKNALRNRAGFLTVAVTNPLYLLLSKISTHVFISQ